MFCIFAVFTFAVIQIVTHIHCVHTVVTQDYKILAFVITLKTNATKNFDILAMLLFYIKRTLH